MAIVAQLQNLRILLIVLIKNALSDCGNVQVDLGQLHNAIKALCSTCTVYYSVG